MNPALSIRNLSVRYPGDPPVRAVDGLSFGIAAGEIVGLAGESGCGKTATANAIMGLLDRSCLAADSIALGETELTSLDERKYRRLRGREISMIFQEPQTALDPVRRVGSQLCAVIRRFKLTDSRPAATVARDALRAMGLADPEELMRRYPHELSGGMRQRVLIAMAMVGRPRVLIADEPTTALDVTTQAMVLNELMRLGREVGCAILLITHDLGLAASTCQRIMIMRGGRLLESAPVEDLLAAPKHPYTRELLDAVPKLEAPPLPGDGPTATAPDADPAPLLALRDHCVSHPVRIRGRRQKLVAVRNAGLDIRRGEVLGLVGESGCGKSTLARSLVGLNPAESGQLLLDGAVVDAGKRAAWAGIRRRVQLVFQDPRASLSPRRTIGQTLREPLDHFNIGSPQSRPGLVEEALERVRLDPGLASRFPGELSGGQRQRVALARALAARPDLIVADEPLSSLDVSIQARMIELLRKLRQELGFALLLVSHDLAVLRQLADRIAVMYLGRIVETGPADTVFTRPAHPYTRILMQAAARAPGRDDAKSERGTQGAGEPPSPLTPPPGCVFHTRCPEAMSHCREIDPPEVAIGQGTEGQHEHRVRCLLYD